MRIERGHPPAARLLKARAYLQLNQIPQALREAEALCLEGPARLKLTTPIPVSQSLEESRQKFATEPKNVYWGERLAEKIFEKPAAERDLNQLASLARSFPQRLRLQWLVYQSELEQGRHEQAAQTLLDLAAALVLNRP